MIKQSKHLSNSKLSSISSDSEDEIQNQTFSSSNQNNQTVFACIFSQKEVLLATALFTIYSADQGLLQSMQFLIDYGSQTSFISMNYHTI